MLVRVFASILVRVLQVDLLVPASNASDLLLAFSSTRIQARSLSEAKLIYLLIVAIYKRICGCDDDLFGFL